MQLSFIKKTTLILLFLGLSVSYVKSQSTVTLSIPFNDGAIGVIGSNPQENDNIRYLSTYNISKINFSQTVSNTANPQFAAQGNDIIGSLTIFFENKNSVKFDAYLVWNEKSGNTPILYGFNAVDNVTIDFSDYDNTLNYILVGGKDQGKTNISLLRNDKSYTFPPETQQIKGSADTSKLLSDLNEYLSIVNGSKPSGPITVNSLTTCDSTPIVTGTVSMSMQDGEYLEINLNGSVYEYTNTNSNTSDVTYDAVNNTWSLQVPSATATGTYNVDAYIANAQGYILQDSSNEELTIIENIIPTITSQTFSYDENRVEGQVIGTVTATTGTNLTFSIVSLPQSPGLSLYDDGTSYFSINSSTGEIYMNSTGISSRANDFELIPNMFEIQVQVSNTCSETASATFYLELQDVDETESIPPTISDQSFEYDENQLIGYEVGKVSATDNIGVSSYVITGGASGYFEIDSSTG